MASTLESSGKHTARSLLFVEAFFVLLGVVLVSLVLDKTAYDRVINFDVSDYFGGLSSDANDAVKDYVSGINMSFNVSAGLGNITLPSLGDITLTSGGGENITVAFWNLDGFGSEEVDKDVTDFVVDSIEGYDVVVLGGVDDAGGAFSEVCKMMRGYRCLVSARSGVSTKRQYGILYRGLDGAGVRDFSLELGGEVFEWPPYSVVFRRGGWEFMVTALNTLPSDAEVEIASLELRLKDDEFNGDDVVVGSLNADCDYYNTPPKDFIGWQWIIRDGKRTTKDLKCAFDRIIVSEKLKDNVVGYDIEDDVEDAGTNHYIVSATIKSR